ncbi:RNA polymerase sigma factor [Nonomuraea maritima]|uniref:RNA polymerase sigma factor n=1 Tax=Nonomuraea maritima TaxID=683260 RepID=UPI0037133C78
MTQPITDQRPRAELIAELYDLHAARLFAYCADQLGDLGTASDVVAAVLSGVPATAPPRAALYAFARREIQRRDVVRAPFAVDPLDDPATALVERTLRELRPHQREVLVLCGVCGLSTDELAWVLGVASDTADELVTVAAQQFRQSLGAALASSGVRLSGSMADVYGALAVAPLPDVLGRLPWPQPPGALRIHFAGSRTAEPAPLFVKPRWPSPPVWPQPLAESDPASSTVIFPAELLTPPAESQVAEHEATTAPMPKYQESAGFGGDILESPAPLRDPLGSTRAFRLPNDPPPLPTRPTGTGATDAGGTGTAATGAGPDVARPQGAGFFAPRKPAAPKPAPGQGERTFFLAAPTAAGVEPFATGDVILPKDAPDPYMTGDVLVHQGLASNRRRQTPPPLDPQPTPVEFLRLPSPSAAPVPESPVANTTVQAESPAETVQPTESAESVEVVSRDTAPLFQPRAKQAEATPDGLARESVLAPRPVRSRPAPKRRPAQSRQRVRRKKERHYDWAWETLGFLICVAIAMAVFFSMPVFQGP